jgi:Putative addiction module component
MLDLDQLISEATALPEAAKAILVDRVVASMVTPVGQDFLMDGVKQAQKRLDEVDSGAVSTVPGDIALAQVRRLLGK